MKSLGLHTETGADDAVLVVLDGELDIASAPAFEAELEKVEAGDPKVLIIDLRAVGFIDSTGLRAVVAADYRAREAGRRVAIVRGSAAVERIFSLTRLEDSLELIDDPESLTQA